MGLRYWKADPTQACVPKSRLVRRRMLESSSLVCSTHACMCVLRQIQLTRAEEGVCSIQVAASPINVRAEIARLVRPPLHRSTRLLHFQVLLSPSTLQSVLWEPRPRVKEAPSRYVMRRVRRDSPHLPGWRWGQVMIQYRLLDAAMPRCSESATVAHSHSLLR